MTVVTAVSATVLAGGLGPVLGVGTEQEATVGPGLAGFLVMFALALATFVLLRSMVGRLRKVRYGPGAGGGTDDVTPADRSGPQERTDGPDGAR